MSEAAPLLPRVFAETAKAHKRRVAIEVPPGRGRPERTCVTYGELAERAAAYARQLAPVTSRDAIVALRFARESVDLYAAQLGVWMSGAAFTCIDPTFPEAHVRALLDDARPVAVLSGPPHAAPSPPPRPPDANSLAYVVYTSGTTGQPKGVMVEHGGIAHLVRSDVDEFGLRPDARVAQCSSPAYDSSIEETWLAFAAGATLVVVDDETARSGPDLAPWLARERITVFCPPPTLLRALGDARLPALRLLYVGGEALPQDLADRWAPGRLLVNGYGPTECTVTVLRGRVHEGRPVTIGTPVRGHRAWIGGGAAEGELCIAGPGIARGYLRRPQESAQKFPSHPEHGRYCRTGDLVRRDAGGAYEYLGRIDAQVKVRGYRIELEAVEARLAGCAGVRAAGCRVQGSLLAAHLVADGPLDLDAIRRELRAALPPHMVPSRLATIDRLPTGVGGKLDRRALPEIAAPAGAAAASRNDAEREVAAAFATALGCDAPPSIHDDFFVDLGGDSLTAVGVVTAIRGGRGGAVTVRDLYEAPTVAALAARLRRPRPVAAAPPPAPGGSTVLFTLAQALFLCAELAAASAVAWWLWFGLLPLLVAGAGLAGTLLLAPPLLFALLLLYAPLSVLAVALAKRLLVGRYRAGRHAAWGSFHLRHWIVAHCASRIPWRLLQGTVLLDSALRLLGARIGRKVHLHRGIDLARGGWDLLSIGDLASCGRDVALRTVDLSEGHLVCGAVTIGDGATLDVRASLGPGSAVGREGYLGAHACVADGANVPDGERWEGVPAAAAGRAAEAPAIGRGVPMGPARHAIASLLARLLLWVVGALPAVLLALAAARMADDPAARLLSWLEAPALTPRALALALGLPLLSLPLRLLLQAAALRCMGRVRAGTFPRASLDAVRLFAKIATVESAGRWLSGSLLWPRWLALAGMRVGRGCEVSTILDAVPESVAIGPESFFADGIHLGGPAVHRGAVTVGDTRIGARTFLGNHAVVPAGHVWPEDLFVGVSTVADPARARPGSAWFGLPAIELPARQVVACDRRLTHDPAPVRFATRCVWEALRFGVPALPGALVLGWLWAVGGDARRAPLATLAAGALAVFAALALKWLLLGRVRPGQHVFWSCWCGRWDLLYVAWGFWAGGPLAALGGTLLLNGFLRLAGMRIGRRVLLGRGFEQVIDPDMLEFGDGATVTCQFQAHSFEDRVLKIDRLTIGPGATAGHNAVVFYGAALGEGVAVGANSVAMKGERLSAPGRYSGSPLARV